ncbi:MAG: type II toxin-antitoxin system MqsA family antitoxin [Saprospiraceae bacterium]|nr:type II toxin-antitoxin system MqsA family antitoxin [Saprospiraceae bacterium]
MAHIPSKCTICEGKVASGKTTFTVDWSAGVVVVRNVPAFVCTQCGEEWIDDLTTVKLEAIAARAEEQNTQIEVMTMG